MELGEIIKIQERGQVRGVNAEIIKVDGDLILVRLLEGPWANVEWWYGSDELAPVTQVVERALQVDSPLDFSHSGLGIGGLADYEEPAFVPTASQMEKLERMEAQARYCRKCGCSDVFDGAMFTTDPSSGLCDDCY